MIEREGMIERAGEGAFDYRLHGGDGVGRFQWYFLDRSRLPVSVQRWELPPGASEGMHTHGDDQPLEELYLVVAGTATMRLGAETLTLGPGDAVVAPAGCDHDLRNTGDTPLEVVVVWGKPAEADFSDYGMARAARASRAAR